MSETAAAAAGGKLLLLLLLWLRRRLGQLERRAGFTPQALRLRGLLLGGLLLRLLLLLRRRRGFSVGEYDIPGAKLRPWGLPHEAREGLLRPILTAKRGRPPQP